MTHDFRLLVIGAIGGFVGTVVFNFGPLDELSALNQWLMGTVAAGGTMWTLVAGTGVSE